MKSGRIILCGKESPGRQDVFGDLVIDYSLERPFEGWTEDDIADCHEAALSHNPINLEISSLVITELRTRGGDFSDARRKLKESGGQLIPWLNGARYRIQNHIDNFELSDRLPKNCKVYLILSVVI